MADSVPATRRKKSLQAALDQAEDERRRKLLSQRIDIARSGVLSYQRHRAGDAVKSFHSYIRILEELKGCPEGGLMPTMFDFKRDLQELLLISGVYWDMAKMYDRTQSADRLKDFRHYLHKYIIFSKNMPYQVLCAETMRKFLNTSKPVHVKEFKAAYIELAGNKCFVVSSLVDVIDGEAISYWRGFRDERLQSSRPGRAFVRFYYRVGPAMAFVVDKMPRAVRRFIAKVLETPLK
mgnify:CR=1 FL=1